MRRSSPGSPSYRTYYEYGSTIPPRDSPFQGPYQAQYHFRAQRFTGTPSNSHHHLANDDDDTSIGSGDSLSNRMPHTESARSQQKSPGEDASENNEEDDSSGNINIRASATEPGPIRCCVFKASRDGGPQPFPRTQYEAPFRFQLRIPDDAPESFAWAEKKEGCCIELRYRLFVVFKLRAQPRDISYEEDPLYWEGAIRNGENPLIVLFSESYIDINPRPDSMPRDDVYFKHAALLNKSKGGQLHQARKSQPKKRSLFGRRALSIEIEDGIRIDTDDNANADNNDTTTNNNVEDGPRRLHRVGDNIKLKVHVKCARPNSILPVLPSQDDGDVEDGEENSDGVRACDLKVELVEKVVLRQGRKEIRSKSVRSIIGRCVIEESGTGSTTIEVRTDEGDIYPSANIGNLSVRHELKVTLLPGRSRLSLCTRVPITLAGGEGQFIQREEQNETLYPQRGRQPPWRRERTRRQERERKKREEISRIISTLPVFSAECDENNTGDGDDESEEDVCAICLDDTSAKKAVVLRCSHRFHAECVQDWMVQKAECPSCRISVLE